MIQKLTINNFKCFSSQSINFGPLTVLAGMNGVGKSTVIQSLLIIRQYISKISSDDKHILLNGTYLLNLGNTNEILNSTAKGNNISFDLEGKCGSDTFMFNAPDGNLGLYPDTINNPPNIHNSYSIYSNEFYYLNAERLGPRNTQSVIDQGFINTGFQGEYTGQAIYKLENENAMLNETDKRIFRLNGEDTYCSAKKQIELWMDYIVPGVQINIDAYPKVNLVRTSLKRTYAETDFLNPYNMGFGITYLLPIIVTCLIAKPNRIVIIENPEAHLHPQGQSRVGQFLARVAASGVQVIIETHSDHVINGIRIAVANSKLSHSALCINFFSQDKRELSPTVDTINISENGDLTHWPYGFLDQEEQDLAELFNIKRD